MDEPQCSCPGSAGRNWAFTTIVCDAPGMFTPSMNGATPDETTGYGWFTADEIRDLPLHPGFGARWEAVMAARDNSVLKCAVRRVGLNGQVMWEHPDPCPCGEDNLAAGGGGPEFMPHDAAGIQHGRASGSRGGGTAGHYDDGGLVRPAERIVQDGDDGLNTGGPRGRGVPNSQLLPGYQNGYWPRQEPDHQDRQPPSSAPGKNLPRGNGGARKTANKVAEVYAQLEGNFPDDAIQWVRECYWTGPLDIPLDDIDFRDHKEWAAWHEQAHVDDFVRKIRAGESIHPPVLIHHPGKQQAVVIDGHHRSLAYEQLGLPVRGWLGEIPEHFIQAALETHSSQDNQGGSKENQ